MNATPFPPTDVLVSEEGDSVSPANHAMGASAAAHVAVTLKALADPLRLRMLSLIATRACPADV